MRKANVTRNETKIASCWAATVYHHGMSKRDFERHMSVTKVSCLEPHVYNVNGHSIQVSVFTTPKQLNS